MTYLWTLLICLGVVYLIVVLAITWLSARPVRVPLFFSPGSVEAPQEEVEFESRGNRLKGWWVDSGGDSVAVLCHGYLMNRSELAPMAVWLWRRGVSSLVFDFPAHGSSGGQVCGLGLREAADVAQAVAYARSRRPEAKIVLIGSSMGGAACGLALGHEPDLADALILDCAYSRLWVAGLGWWRFVGGSFLAAFLFPTLPLGWLLSGVNPFRVDVAAKLKGFHGRPALLIHGECDSLVPPSEALRNQEALGGPPIVWMEGCGHAEGRWLKPEIYYGAIEGFLEENGLISQKAKLKGPLP